MTIFLFAFVLQGCGVLVGNPEQPDDDTEVQGMIAMGPVGGATVTAYALAEDGSRGAVLTSTTSDAAGNYVMALDYGSPLVIVATGGSYEDEATGEAVVIASGQELESGITSTAEGAFVSVNGLTTMVMARARRNAAMGLTNALGQARNEVGAAFGLSGVDLKGTTPGNMTQTRERKGNPSQAGTRYGFVIAGMSQLLADNDLPASQGMALVRALADDYADGGFDGLIDGEELSVSAPIDPEEAVNGLGQSVRNFADSGRNQSGITSAELSIAIPAAPTTPTPKP